MTGNDQFDAADDDEFDDEPILSDVELTAFEKSLFAAIREAHKLDTEIDDECRRLPNGESTNLDRLRAQRDASVVGSSP